MLRDTIVSSKELKTLLSGLVRSGSNILGIVPTRIADNGNVVEYVIFYTDVR